MLNYLLHNHLADGIFWVIIGLLELMAVLALWHGRAVKTYPAFALYIHFAAIETIVLMALPPGDHFRVYTWISYPWSTVQCLLIGVCVWDLYARTLGPRASLPAWVPRELGAGLGTALLVSAILSAVFQPQYGTGVLRGFAVVQEIIVAAAALALWFLIFYAHRLGIPWWPRDAHLASGFVLMLTLNAVTLLVIWSSAVHVGAWAQRIGQFGALSSLGWWSWTLWGVEAVPEKATNERTAAVLAHHREDVAVVVLAKEVLE